MSTHFWIIAGTIKTNSEENAKKTGEILRSILDGEPSSFQIFASTDGTVRFVYSDDNRLSLLHDLIAGLEEKASGLIVSGDIQSTDTDEETDYRHIWKNGRFEGKSTHYWAISGTIRANSRENAKKVRRILRSTLDEVSFPYHMSSDKTVEFSYNGDNRLSLLRDLISELEKQASGLIVSGDIRSTDKNTETEYRHIWKDGKFEEYHGVLLLPYYAGLEDDFIRQLPKAVINRIKSPEGADLTDADFLASVSTGALVREMRRRVLRFFLRPKKANRKEKKSGMPYAMLPELPRR